MSVRQLLNIFLLSQLCACGSGGVDEIPQPTAFLPPLLANWVTTHPTRQPNCELVTTLDGRTLLSKEGPISVTARAYYETFYLYALQDTTCSDVQDFEVQTYTVAWSGPISADTPPGAVRATLTGPTITYEEVPAFIGSAASSSVKKALFRVENGVFKSWFSTLTSALDAQGYPLGTDLPARSYTPYNP